MAATACTMNLAMAKPARKTFQGNKAVKKGIERIEACEVGSQRNLPWMGARSTKSIASSLPQTLTFIPPCSPTVSMKANRAATRVSRPVVVRASSEKKHVQVEAATITALSTVLMAMPAEATSITPSLKNLIGSVVAGGVVLLAIFGAIVGVSNFDKVRR